LIQQFSYRILQKWAIIFCLLILARAATAQSDYSDSIVQEILEEQDSVYSSPIQSQSDSIIYRSTPDSTIMRMQKMKEFAYANDPEYWIKQEKVEPTPGSNAGWQAFFTLLQYLAYGIFIFVLIYILVRILSDSKIILFKRRAKPIVDSQEEEPAEEKDLMTLIQEAEAQTEYRLAARYRYMQLLEHLHARQLIGCMEILRTGIISGNWEPILLRLNSDI
jgi:hypothetical protein